MSQSDFGDARDDQTGRFQLSGALRRPQPLSPHLQVWRFHVTMTASILHRITGSALIGGAVLVLLWLAALACGPEAYGLFSAVMASPFSSPRQMPVKVTSAPTSVRPRDSAAASAEASKGSRWTLTVIVGLIGVM